MDQHEHNRRDEGIRRGLRDDERDGQGHLVLHAENVDVHTERVATGRVTLRKTVVTEEVTVPVTLRHERLEVVEETFDEPQAPVSGGTRDARPATDAPVGAGDRAVRTDVRQLDDGDVEITLYAERPVVSVEVVPVERVRLSRGVVTQTEKVTVDVQHEEAYLDREDLSDHDRDRDLRNRR